MPINATVAAVTGKHVDEPHFGFILLPWYLREIQTSMINHGMWLACAFSIMLWCIQENHSIVWITGKTGIYLNTCSLTFSLSCFDSSFFTVSYRECTLMEFYIPFALLRLRCSPHSRQIDLQRTAVFNLLQ